MSSDKKSDGDEVVDFETLEEVDNVRPPQNRGGYSRGTRGMRSGRRRGMGRGNYSFQQSFRSGNQDWFDAYGSSFLPRRRTEEVLDLANEIFEKGVVHTIMKYHKKKKADARLPDFYPVIRRYRRNKNFSTTRFKMYCQEHKKLIILLLCINNTLYSPFYRISKDVLIHRIIPYISELDSFLLFDPFIGPYYRGKLMLKSSKVEELVQLKKHYSRQMKILDNFITGEGGKEVRKDYQTQLHICEVIDFLTASVRLKKSKLIKRNEKRFVVDVIMKIVFRVAQTRGMIRPYSDLDVTLDRQFRKGFTGQGILRRILKKSINLLTLLQDQSVKWLNSQLTSNDFGAVKNSRFLHLLLISYCINLIGRRRSDIRFTFPFGIELLKLFHINHPKKERRDFFDLHDTQRTIKKGEKEYAMKNYQYYISFASDVIGIHVDDYFSQMKESEDVQMALEYFNFFSTQYPPNTVDRSCMDWMKFDSAFILVLVKNVHRIPTKTAKLLSNYFIPIVKYHHLISLSSEYGVTDYSDCIPSDDFGFFVCRTHRRERSQDNYDNMMKYKRLKKISRDQQAVENQRKKDTFDPKIMNISFLRKENPTLLRLFCRFIDFCNAKTIIHKHRKKTDVGQRGSETEESPSKSSKEKKLEEKVDETKVGSSGEDPSGPSGPSSLLPISEDGQGGSDEEEVTGILDDIFYEILTIENSALYANPIFLKFFVRYLRLHPHLFVSFPYSHYSSSQVTFVHRIIGYFESVHFERVSRSPEVFSNHHLSILEPILLLYHSMKDYFDKSNVQSEKKDDESEGNFLARFWNAIGIIRIIKTIVAKSSDVSELWNETKNRVDKFETLFGHLRFRSLSEKKSDTNKPITLETKPSTDEEEKEKEDEQKDVKLLSDTRGQPRGKTTSFFDLNTGGTLDAFDDDDDDDEDDDIDDWTGPTTIPDSTSSDSTTRKPRNFGSKDIRKVMMIHKLPKFYFPTLKEGFTIKRKIEKLFSFYIQEIEESEVQKKTTPRFTIKVVKPQYQRRNNYQQKSESRQKAKLSETVPETLDVLFEQFSKYSLSFKKKMMNDDDDDDELMKKQKKDLKRRNEEFRDRYFHPTTVFIKRRLEDQLVLEKFRKSQQQKENELMESTLHIKRTKKSTTTRRSFRNDNPYVDSSWSEMNFGSVDNNKEKKKEKAKKYRPIHTFQTKSSQDDSRSLEEYIGLFFSEDPCVQFEAMIYFNGKYRKFNTLLKKKKEEISEEEEEEMKRLGQLLNNIEAKLKVSENGDKTFEHQFLWVMGHGLDIIKEQLFYLHYFLLSSASSSTTKTTEKEEKESNKEENGDHKLKILFDYDNSFATNKVMIALINNLSKFVAKKFTSMFCVFDYLSHFILRKFDLLSSSKQEEEEKEEEDTKNQEEVLKNESLLIFLKCFVTYISQCNYISPEENVLTKLHKKKESLSRFNGVNEHTEKMLIKESNGFPPGSFAKIVHELRSVQESDSDSDAPNGKPKSERRKTDDGRERRKAKVSRKRSNLSPKTSKYYHRHNKNHKHISIVHGKRVVDEDMKNFRFLYRRNRHTVDGVVDAYLASHHDDDNENSDDEDEEFDDEMTDDENDGMNENYERSTHIRQTETVWYQALVGSPKKKGYGEFNYETIGNLEHQKKLEAQKIKGLESLEEGLFLKHHHSVIHLFRFFKLFITLINTTTQQQEEEQKEKKRNEKRMRKIFVDGLFKCWNIISRFSNSLLLELSKKPLNSNELEIQADHETCHKLAQKFQDSVVIRMKLILDVFKEMSDFVPKLIDHRIWEFLSDYTISAIRFLDNAKKWNIKTSDDDKTDSIHLSFFHSNVIQLIVDNLIHNKTMMNSLYDHNNTKYEYNWNKYMITKKGGKSDDSREKDEDDDEDNNNTKKETKEQKIVNSLGSYILTIISLLVQTNDHKKLIFRSLILNTISLLHKQQQQQQKLLQKNKKEDDEDLSFYLTNFFTKKAFTKRMDESVKLSYVDFLRFSDLGIFSESPTILESILLNIVFKIKKIITPSYFVEGNVFSYIQYNESKNDDNNNTNESNNQSKLGGEDDVDLEMVYECLIMDLEMLVFVLEMIQSDETTPMKSYSYFLMPILTHKEDSSRKNYLLDPFSSKRERTTSEERKDSNHIKIVQKLSHKVVSLIVDKNQQFLEMKEMMEKQTYSSFDQQVFETVKIVELFLEIKQEHEKKRKEEETENDGSKSSSEQTNTQKEEESLSKVSILDQQFESSNNNFDDMFPDINFDNTTPSPTVMSFGTSSLSTTNSAKNDDVEHSTNESTVSFPEFNFESISSTQSNFVGDHSLFSMSNNKVTRTETETTSDLHYSDNYSQKKSGQQQKKQKPFEFSGAFSFDDEENKEEEEEEEEEHKNDEKMLKKKKDDGDMFQFENFLPNIQELSERSSQFTQFDMNPGRRERRRILRRKKVEEDEMDIIRQRIVNDARSSTTTTTTTNQSTNNASRTNRNQNNNASFAEYTDLDELFNKLNPED